MPNDIPRDVRAAVKLRDFSRCVACGAPGSDIHHRMRRREGGHSLANCLLLCRTDHAQAHSKPEWARVNGLIIPTWVGAENVWSVPVHGWRGWLLHLEAGDVQSVTGKVDDALEYVTGKFPVTGKEK